MVSSSSVIPIGNAITYSRSGGWGKERPFESSVRVAIIRGADFPAVVAGDCKGLPIRYEKQSKVESVSLQCGDIVLENSGGTSTRPTGRTILVTQQLLDAYDCPVIPASFCRLLRFGCDFNDTFAYYWLQEMYKAGRTWSYQNRSTGLSNFQYQTFATHEMIPLLGIDEQRTIASILFALDRGIVLNNRTNGYLLQLTKLQLKDYLSQAVDTPLVSVGDYVGSMSNGATPSRKNAAFWDDGNIPWVKTGEVNNGLILKTEEHVTRLALEKTSIKLLPVDTVIMALYGSGTAGRLGILQIEATTNQACTAMVCKSSIEAFYLFVTLEGMYRQIDNMTRGSVQQNLSKDLVAEIQIPRIPRQVLEEMGLAEYYAQIAVNMRESDGLASIRDALLPKLMSGEIDVSQIDLPTPPNSHLRER